MTKKKILAVILTVALLVTQFAMLGVSAETAALSGRSDFAMGVAVHKSDGYEAYRRPYNVILDAAAMGSNLIRTDAHDDEYDAVFAHTANANKMKVMFVTSLGVKFANTLTADDYQAVYDKFYAKATALKDYDVYIQIGNEIDNDFYKSGGIYDGTSVNKYNDVTKAAIAIYAANKAVKDANTANGSNIKTVLNFSFNHYGFLKALKNIKIDAASYAVSNSGSAVADWDIIGWDYYSNMADDASYSSILSGLKSEFDKKIIVCESNLTPESRTSNGTIKYAKDAAWLEGFVNACYADSRVIGFVAYELYDQPAIENSSFNAEAHFGLIDKDGNKKNTYKTICALYGGKENAGLAKNRVITEEAPAYLDYATVDMLKGTIASEWSPSYSKTRDNLIVDLTANPLNIKDTISFLEFDIYIEDYESFVKAIEGKRINFVLSSNATKTADCARYDFASQITKSGWNHVQIGSTSQWTKDSAFKSEEVKWAYINFQDGGDDFNPIAGSKTAIANICGTPSEINITPATPANAVLEISKKGKLKAWGKQFSYVTDDMYIDVGPLDLTVSKFIEFDIYIEDQAAFHSAFDTHALRFYMSSADNKNNNRRTYNFVDQITKDGWNHIVLNREARYSSDSTKQEAIKHVGLACYSNTGDSNPLKGVNVRIANIYCTDKPAANENAVVDLCTRLRNYETGSSNDLKGVSKYDSFDGKKETVLANDISGCDNIEFDFYCASYPTFLKNIEGKTFYFVLTTSGGGRARYKFTDQVTKNGWNHIVIDKKSYNNIGESAPNFANVKEFYFSFWGPTGSMVNTDNPLYATNVCGTLYEYKRIPDALTEANIAIHEGRNYDNVTKYSDFADKPKAPSSPVDISAADYIEFDMYIGDYNNFLSTIDGHPVYFVLRTKANNNDNRAVYDFVGQITKSGWNHIKLEITKTKENKNADFSKVAAYNFAFWNDSGKTTAFPGGVWAIANLCATYDSNISIPTEVMKDKTDFIGAELTNISFNGDGLSIENFDVENIDISGESMMIEIDVFVLASSTSTFAINLFDGADNEAVYEFEGLVDGWNRLAIRTTDAIIEETFDFNDIVYFDFSADARSSVRVANFYAAEYVKGDGNRDGVVDVKDLIRIRNYNLGNPNADGTIGNKVAMDVDGDDYVIAASDLAALKYNLLTNTWR